MKIFVTVTLHLIGLVLCIDTHVCKISKVIGINKDKEICLANKKCVSGHRCEGTNKAVMYKICMNCREKSIGIYRKTYTTAKQGIHRGL